MKTHQTAFTELMIRIQSLRRNIDDANRALVCGNVTCLSGFPEEVQAVTSLALNVPLDRRQQAIVALNALDADINAYTRILSLWQNHSCSTAPSQIAACG